MARAILLVLLLLTPASAWAQSCPAQLGDARKLVLVVADTMSSNTATLWRFERTSADAAWTRVGRPESALIGYRGIAWAPSFRGYARPGEPIKTEGDKRNPGGVFPIGRPFGFAASHDPNYVHIADGTVCVDDPSSLAYNTITTRGQVGTKVHAENMWRAQSYRRGLLVDYPTDAKARAGSCIFIHLRLPSATGTAGCVALPEPQLVGLQAFAQSGAVLAVLPKQAMPRFKGCLPN